MKREGYAWKYLLFSIYIDANGILTLAQVCNIWGLVDDSTFELEWKQKEKNR